MSKRPKLRYFNMGPWPVFVGFTQSEKAFAREMKRMKIDDPPSFVTTSHANATTHYFERKGRSLAIVITLPPSKHSMAQIAALLAHEATHVSQEVFEYLGEKQPGREAEAYLVQYVTQECLLDVKRNRKAAKKASAKV